MSADTPQTLHPLGGITARVATMLCVVVSAVLVLVEGIGALDEVSSPVAFVVSLAAFAGAILVLLRATSPFRAPFSTTSHLAFVALLVVMLLAETLSTYGLNSLILDGYGYLVVGLLMFPLGSFRAPGAILLTVACLAPLVAILAFAQAPFLEAPYPPVVFALVTVAPVLAVGTAAAAFSRSLITQLREARAENGVQESQVLEAEVAPLSILADDVLPLLERVSNSQALSEDDVQDAQRLGSQLRGILVAESGAGLLPAWRGRIDDPDRLLADWSMRERTALLALAQAIAEAEPTAELTLTVRSDGWLFRAEGLPRQKMPRDRLAPYAATIGVAFGGARVRRRGDVVEVRGAS